MMTDQAIPALDSPAPARITLDVAIAECTLGLVLVAWSAAGIAAVLLGDDAAAMRADVAARFPRAALVARDASDAVVAGVVAVIDAPARGPEPGATPLDLRGTAFQRAVWDALREIPAGTTATYAEVARRIGRPASVRAVAQACAANALAVLVPCHRVVRSDGGLSGYRWGVERKRALLAREATVSESSSRGENTNPRG